MMFENMLEKYVSFDLSGREEEGSVFVFEKELVIELIFIL